MFQGPEGNIEPVLHYYCQYEESPDQKDNKESNQNNKNSRDKQNKKAIRWIKNIIKDNRVHKIINAEVEIDCMESENYNQILDAR